MSESSKTSSLSEHEENQSNEDDTTIWEPVQDNNQEYNDYPLAFVNVDKEDDSISYNVDGDEITPEGLDSPGPMIVGEFQGINDISSDDNPEPSIKVLVDSDDDERTYALNKVKALEQQLAEVEEGERIGLDFDGYVHPEDDGLPWQNWTVYTPSA